MTQQGIESAVESEDKKMMTKLEAIVQPSRFEAVKEVLTELGIGGMTISDVRGHGRQKGHTEVYRGREYTVDLLPKIKIEIVIPDNLVDAAIDAILQSASTGKIGDGKIFTSKVDQAIRIPNPYRGVSVFYIVCVWFFACFCRPRLTGAAT
jgi:nitrogen regulatory protein P-II 1